jgi:hypothetical protein
VIVDALPQAVTTRSAANREPPWQGAQRVAANARVRERRQVTSWSKKLRFEPKRFQVADIVPASLLYCTAAYVRENAFDKLNLST